LVSIEQLAQSPEDRQEEPPHERLDRNTSDFLGEVRIAATGIQVLFAFLLIVPFNQGWKYVTSFDRYVYYATLVCVAVATALLLAPSINHRILFRQHEKAYLVRLGNQMMIAAMVFEVAALTGILVLISNYVFGGVAAGIAGGVTAVITVWLWFGIPFIHQLRDPSPTDPG
jgi:hypothetical protein